MIIWKLALFGNFCLLASAFVTVRKSSDALTRVDPLRFSDWSDFQALEDEDDDLLIDRTEYAREEDTQEDKARVGATLEAPTIEFDAEPLFVPQGNNISSALFCDLFSRVHLAEDFFKKKELCWNYQKIMFYSYFQPADRKLVLFLVTQKRIVAWV